MPQTAGTMGHAEKSKCQDGAVRVQSRLNSYFEHHPLVRYSCLAVFGAGIAVWALWRLIANFGLLGSHRTWVVVVGSVVALCVTALLIGMSRVKVIHSVGLISTFVVLVLVVIAAAPARGGNITYPQSPELQFLGDAVALVFALSVGPIVYTRLRRQTLGTQHGLGTTMVFTPSHLRKATFTRGR